MNRPSPSNTPETQPADLELPINCEKPSRNEIRKAVMKLTNDKAPEADNIPAEALKADIDTTVEMLYPLFCKDMGG